MDELPRVICGKWYHENVVLMGDAAATGHFSIGSGTRLAMDSAIALAEYLHSEPTLEGAFQRYQDERRVEVLRLQSAARNSLEWFEQVERYLDLPPEQFAYSLLTAASGSATKTCACATSAWLGRVEDWFQAQAGGQKGRRPMFAPFRLRNMALKNRVVVSPMAQYKAVDGCPTDWHLIHYAERAKGGAGLVYTEMTCTSAQGRITPGCPGLYAPEHEAAWKRIVDFVHAETTAKICCQIGHAGGRPARRWAGKRATRPCHRATGRSSGLRGPVVRPQCHSARDDAGGHGGGDGRVRFGNGNGPPRGVDMVELHAAHGYLVSSFISPVSNRRTDDYGGRLENRMRWPLEVLKAMRAAWGEDKPLSVRISATDWVGDHGVTPDEAVEIARLFAANGADIIDVSAGQTSTDARPIYGRMFQTPFSDRIRNEAGLATMAVGNITEADQVNGILLGGRADLVCLARPHLADPYWTLHAAVAAGDSGTDWPLPYLAGRDQMRRLAQRATEVIRA